MSLKALRREYDDVGIGPLLHARLDVIVRGVCRRMPAPFYSPEGDERWSEDGYAAVAHEWCIARLLNAKRRHLERYPDQAATCEELDRLLRKSLRGHLLDSLPSTPARLMRKRVLEALPAVAAPAGPSQTPEATVYGECARVPRAVLDAWLGARSDAELRRLSEHALSGRNPVVIKQADLEVLVRDLLAAAGGSVTAGDVIDALIARFDLADAVSVAYDDEFDVAAFDADPEAEARVEELAEELHRELELKDARRLRAYHVAGYDESAAGAALGENRRNVRRARERLREKLHARCVDGTQALAVYDRVMLRVITDG